MEHQQTYQSFFVKHDLNTLLDNPKYLTDTNDYAGFLPPDDTPLRLGGYGLTTTFTESISWQLLRVTNLLIAYELILTTHGAALGGKPYSWVPEEAFVAVGWFLEHYWNPDSLLFNPRDQLEVSQDDPFTITTTTLPEQNQQHCNLKQSDQQNPPSQSSGQQASGVTTHATGSVNSLLSSGSGGGNEGPEQDQHTLGLACYADSCHGVCELRKAPNRSEFAEGALISAEKSLGRAHYAMTEIQPLPSQAHQADAKVAYKTRVFVSRIIKQMNWLMTILIENDVHSKAESPSPDIQVFRNAIELLEHLEPSDISKISQPFSVRPECDGSVTGYHRIYYRGKMIFTIIGTAKKTSYESSLTCGFLGSIKTEDLFNELYYAPGAPGYQLAKSEFEEQRKK